MKDLKSSARNLNTGLNLVFWLLLGIGIFTVGFHVRALYRLFTDPEALSGKMELTVDWLTLKAYHGFGIDLDGAVRMKLIQLLSAAAFTYIGCRAIRVLKRILLPIEVGQPFRSGISSDIQSLSGYALWMGFVENLSMLATVILMETHYDLPALLLHDPISRVSIDWDTKPAWFIVSAVLTILAMVFRRGEELQTLSDETL
jgi:hypothetical protein